MRYRVYKQTPRGTPYYETTSTSIGDSGYDMQMICQAHGLLSGDIVHINGTWRLISPPGGETAWEYLEELDTGQRFGDVLWCPATIQSMIAQAEKSEVGLEEESSVW